MASTALGLSGFLGLLATASGLCAQGVGGVQTLGNPCGGPTAAAGLPPTLALSRPLQAGQTSMLIADHLGSPNVGFLLTGWDDDSWNGQPLPLSLASIGMPGCQLQLDPDRFEPFYSPYDSARWLLTVPTSPEMQGRTWFAQAVFYDPSANSRSLATTAGLRMRLDPASAPTALVTQVQQNGITFVFAQPTPAGRFANGDWFVVGPTQVVGMLPDMTTVNGRVMHGAMLDPAASTKDHGYDSDLYTQQFSSHYRPALNHGAVSALSPLQLTPGHALVKVESLTNPTGVPRLRTAAVLTCLQVAPWEESFRPPYSGTDHRVKLHAGMIDWSRLASLPPVAGMPDVSQVTARLDRVWLDHSPSWLGRMMHPTDNMPDYGRDLASLLGEAALLANCAIPEAEKRALALRLVQIGIDCYGNLLDGCHWSGLGGHGSGRKLPILFAGLLLGDEEMLAVGRDYVSGRFPDGSWTAYFGEDCQTFVVEETSPGVYNWGHGGYTAADVGLPEWGFSHVDAPQNDDVTWNGNSYRICCTVNGWLGHVLTARIMGLIDDWNHPPLFDYTDRYMTVELSGWTRSWSPWVGAMWSQYRPAY